MRFWITIFIAVFSFAAIAEKMSVTEAFQFLNLNREASESDLRRAYRRMAAELHPDSGNENASTEAFQRLGEAFEVATEFAATGFDDAVATGGRNIFADDEFYLRHRGAMSGMGWSVNDFSRQSRQTFYFMKEYANVMEQMVSDYAALQRRNPGTGRGTSLIRRVTIEEILAFHQRTREQFHERYPMQLDVLFYSVIKIASYYNQDQWPALDEILFQHTQRLIHADQVERFRWLAFHTDIVRPAFIGQDYDPIRRFPRSLNAIFGIQDRRFLPPEEIGGYSRYFFNEEIIRRHPQFIFRLAALEPTLWDWIIWPFITVYNGSINGVQQTIAESDFPLVTEILAHVSDVRRFQLRMQLIVYHQRILTRYPQLRENLRLRNPSAMLSERGEGFWYESKIIFLEGRQRERAMAQLRLWAQEFAADDPVAFQRSIEMSADAATTKYNEIATRWVGESEGSQRARARIYDQRDQMLAVIEEIRAAGIRTPPRCNMFVE